MMEALLICGVIVILLLAMRLDRCQHIERLVRQKRDERGCLLVPHTLEHVCVHCHAVLGETVSPVP